MGPPKQNGDFIENDSDDFDHISVFMETFALNEFK
jgi:hypothetical protein